MRRLAVIPLALLLGCFDFDSLSGTYVPPLVDASAPGDIACDKTPNQLQEDCTQNGDINNNCLYGCEDPTCSDHVECFASKGYKTYGAVAANAGACPQQTTQTPIYQSLVNPPTCNGSCACTSPTTTCSSNLHIYANKTDCGNAANETFKVAIKEGVGANKCVTPLTTTKDAYYSVDKFTAGGCAAANATVALTATWGMNNVLCDQAAQAGSSKLLRFSDMQKNNIACVVFNGTDTTVCASTKIYTKASVYYTTTTGSSNCMCSCAATGGCTIGNKEIQLTDKAMCNGTQILSEIKATGTAGCVQALDAAMATYMTAAVQDNTPAPTCNATGTVSGTFAPSGGMTVCCM